jgi:hypothetical protein
MVEQHDKNRTTDRSAFSHLPTISRACPPLPFPREELKKDLPFIHPRNESLSNRTNLASTRLPENDTFCGGEKWQTDRMQKPAMVP